MRIERYMRTLTRVVDMHTHTHTYAPRSRSPRWRWHRHRQTPTFEHALAPRTCSHTLRLFRRTGNVGTATLLHANPTPDRTHVHANVDQVCKHYALDVGCIHYCYGNIHQQQRRVRNMLNHMRHAKYRPHSVCKVRG